jgi:hypothetical protein
VSKARGRPEADADRAADVGSELGRATSRRTRPNKLAAAVAAPRLTTRPANSVGAPAAAASPVSVAAGTTDARMRRDGSSDSFTTILSATSTVSPEDDSPAAARARDAQGGRRSLRQRQHSETAVAAAAAAAVGGLVPPLRSMSAPSSEEDEDHASDEDDEEGSSTNGDKATDATGASGSGTAHEHTKSLSDDTRMLEEDQAVTPAPFSAASTAGAASEPSSSSSHATRTVVPKRRAADAATETEPSPGSALNGRMLRVRRCCSRMCRRSLTLVCLVVGLVGGGGMGYAVVLVQAVTKLRDDTVRPFTQLGDEVRRLSDRVTRPRKADMASSSATNSAGAAAAAAAHGRGSTHQRRTLSEAALPITVLTAAVAAQAPPPAVTDSEPEPESERPPPAAPSSTMSQPAGTRRARAWTAPGLPSPTRICSYVRMATPAPILPPPAAAAAAAAADETEPLACACAAHAGEPMLNAVFSVPVRELQQLCFGKGSPVMQQMAHRRHMAGALPCAAHVRTGAPHGDARVRGLAAWQAWPRSRPSRWRTSRTSGSSDSTYTACPSAARGVGGPLALGAGLIGD